MRPLTLLLFMIFTLIFWGENSFARNYFRLTSAQMAPEHMQAQPVSGFMTIDTGSVAINLKALDPANNYSVQLPLIRTQTSRCDVLYTLAQQDLTASEGSKYQIEVWFYRDPSVCFDDQAGTARVFFTTTLNVGTPQERKIISRLYFREAPMPVIAKTVVVCVQENYQADHALILEVIKDEQGKLFLREHYQLFVGNTVKDYSVTFMEPTPGRIGAPVEYKGQFVSLSVNWTTTPTPQGSHGLYLGTDGDRQEVRCRTVPQN